MSNRRRILSLDTALRSFSEAILLYLCRLKSDYAEKCSAIAIDLSASNAAHNHRRMFEPRLLGRTVSSLFKLARIVAAAAGSPGAAAADLTLDGVSFFDVVIG